MRKLLLTLGLIFGLVLVGSPAAFAEEATPMAQAGGSDLVLTPVQWTILTGLLMPFVLGFITKASASSTSKGVMGIFLAAVAATIQRATLVDGSAVFTTALLLDIGLIYGPQLMTYLGLWQHVDINSKLLPAKGFGSKPGA